VIAKHRQKTLAAVVLVSIFFTVFIPLPVGHAAGLGDALGVLAAPTAAAGGNGGLLNFLIGLLLDKFISPIFNIFDGPAPTGGTPVEDAQDTDGVLRGKVIVVDPGHGGGNPGATGNGTRESDNNLAVSLKLRDKLRQAGARVVLTRDSDRAVAPTAATLAQELQARVDIAEKNHADLFVSIHANYSSDPAVDGAMTFYGSDESAKLARAIQTALIRETQTKDKGIAPATFYVLRNTTMPSILVETGFVSNAAEAAKLRSDSYRARIAQGVFSGIVNYLR